MKYEIKVDKSGRVLIPYKIREKYGIHSNDLLLLSIVENGFILKKEDINKKHEKIISKLINLEKNYNISFLLLKNNIAIYTSNDYKKYINSIVSINSVVSKLDTGIYKAKVKYLKEIDLSILLIYKKTEEKIIELIDVILV